MAAPRFRLATLLGLLREHGGRSVADLGCGNGQLLAAIRAQSKTYELCGIDLSETQIAQNRERQPGISWLQADLDRPLDLLPRLIGQFDTVVASELIEHVDHPDELLKNAALLATQERGVLLLSTQTGPIRATEKHVGHQRHFTAEQIRQLLEQTGWRPVRVWNAGFPFHDLSKWVANLRPAEALARFGDQPYGSLENLACALLRFAFLFNSGRRGAQLFAVARLSGPP
jgi:SAM-dependent methyltransferase